MKLIIQNIDGSIYAYRESERHFHAAEKTRGTRRLKPEELDIECNLGDYPNSHFVIDVKKPKKRKKPSKRKMKHAN